MLCFAHVLNNSEYDICVFKKDQTEIMTQNVQRFDGDKNRSRDVLLYRCSYKSTFKIIHGSKVSRSVIAPFVPHGKQLRGNTSHLLQIAPFLT